MTVFEGNPLTQGPAGSSAPSTDLKNPGIVPISSGGNAAIPTIALLHYKKDNNYGFVDGLGIAKKPDETDASAQKKIKDDLAAKNAGSHTDPSNGTAGSQDKGKNIHDALLGADPNQAAAVLKKALQAMVMLKMMDKLTSPAGIKALATGALAGGLAGIASAAGLGGFQNSLNGAMGGLNSIIPQSAMAALQGGMMGVLAAQSVGAVSTQSIKNATATTASIDAAMKAIKAGQSDAVDAVAAFGGPSFGLTPGSLAAKVALVGPGGVLTTTTNVGGVMVNTTVYTSTTPLTTQNIPVLTGMEHIAISTAGIGTVATTLGSAVGVNVPLTTALANTVNGLSSSNVATSSAAASTLDKQVTTLMKAPTASLSTATNASIGSLSASTLGNAVNSSIADMSSQGLNKLLGVGTSGLLGAATKLLPNIGGNIQGTISSHLPKTSLDGGAINTLMTQATKTLSLSRAAYNVSKNIFGQSQAESIAAMVGSTSKIAAQVGSFKAVTPFGDVVHSVAQGIATGNNPGSAIDKVVQGSGIFGKG